MSSAKSGVFPLTREEYDKLNRVNYTRLKELAKSPAHYRHALTEQDDGDTAARKMGRAVHLCTLEPERFMSDCVRWEEGARRGKAWEAFKEQHQGKDILTADEWDFCHAISDAARRDSYAMRYLSGGKAEQSVLWTHTTDAIGGLSGFSMECKGRLDFIGDVGSLVDLKTTRDASPAAFGRQCLNFGYHVQAAFYVDGFEAATGELRPYVVVAVETQPPRVVQVYRMPEWMLEMGRQEYRRLLSLLHLCKSTNRWQGYADGELELEFPPWATPKDEDESLEELGISIGAGA